MKLNPHVVRLLGEIATVQSVAESYQNDTPFSDLKNVFGIIKAPKLVDDVHIYHIDDTIARGQEAELDAAALHASMTDGLFKTVLYVMMSRLAVALEELHAIKELQAKRDKKRRPNE